MIAEGLTPIKRWGTAEDVGRAVGAIVSRSFPFSTASYQCRWRLSSAAVVRCRYASACRDAEKVVEIIDKLKHIEH
jgi:hypothetical protein